ncbi:MAG: hypothetical protein ACLRZ5_08220 [Ruminococcus sp.]
MIFTIVYTTWAGCLFESHREMNKRSEESAKGAEKERKEAATSKECNNESLH